MDKCEFKDNIIIRMNIRKQFRQSLKCGTGEAYYILRENQGIDFSKDIEKAALTNYAYDPQCEPSRAFYISQLIELSGKKEHLVEIIIKALVKERQDSWAIDQLFRLAKIFAKQGNTEAKRAIYKRFNKIAKTTSESIQFLGQEAVLELDGIEGLKHIAEIRGKALVKNTDDWENNFLVDNFQKENPNINVYNELKKASTNNPFIKKYLASIKKHKWSRPKRPKRPKKLNYEFIKERIEGGSKYPATPGIARRLTKTAIKKLADEVLHTKDTLKKEMYLSVFTNTKFPYDYQPILQIAKGKKSRNDRLVWFACKALTFFDAKDIRQFAISKLPKTNIPSDYLPLLITNYKKGDHKLLTKIADRYKNENVIHDLACVYVDIYKANKTKQCKRPLGIIYSKLTCALCRRDIVKILYDNGVLSEKILKEMEFDSNDEIRDFHKKFS